MTTAPTHPRFSADRWTDDELAALRVVAQRAVRSVLGVTDDEEDLVQDVLMRLVVRLRQPGEVDPAAWTWRVARNLAIDHLRARRATPTDPGLLDREVGGGLDDHVIARELAGAVTSSLARLPARQRDALVANAALDGGRGSHALVAAQLGVTPKAAESILARARHALRHELARAGVRDTQWGVVGLLLRGLDRRARALGRAISRSSVAARVATIAMVAFAASGLVVLRPWQGGAPGTSHTPAPSVSARAADGAPLRSRAGPARGAAPGGRGPLPLLTLPSAPTLLSQLTVPPTPGLPRLTLPALGPSASLPSVVTVPRLQP